VTAGQAGLAHTQLLPLTMAPVEVMLPAVPVVTLGAVIAANVADTLVFPVMVKEQVDALPLQAPPQVVKT
jgi:hypothetical protein